MHWLEPGRPVSKAWGGVAALYGLLARLRGVCYETGWCSASRLPCRVISVGNLTVGGTGKTPVVILLVRWLQEAGQRVAVLSRGYKRTGTVPQLLVSEGGKLLVGPAEAGDEPHLIAQRCPGAVVAVGSDRASLGRWVLDRFATDCIILDDGFQHRRLHRDVDLVLLDATDPMGLDALLPAGRLREPLAGLKRAAAVLITRADLPEQVQEVRRRIQPVVNSGAVSAEVRFRPECLIAVSGGVERELASCRGKRVWLASGVGNNASFTRTAAMLGSEVLGVTAFRDHHHYREADVTAIRLKSREARADLVLTTEKDAAKLAPWVAPHEGWWAVRIGAEVTSGEAALRKLVAQAR